MDWRSLLLRISPVLYSGIEEWSRTEKKRLHMASGLVRGGDVGAFKIVEDHSPDGRFIGLKATLIVHSKVSGSDWYSVQGTFPEDTLWPNANLKCTCSERSSAKACSHSLCLLLSISIGQYVEGIITDSSWCKPVTSHLCQRYASKRLLKRPELRELLWTSVAELWDIVTESLAGRTMPAETQRYHIGWSPAIPRGRGLPRGRAARPIISTSFAVASGAQAFRPRRGGRASNSQQPMTSSGQQESLPSEEPPESLDATLIVSDLVDIPLPTANPESPPQTVQPATHQLEPIVESQEPQSRSEPSPSPSTSSQSDQSIVSTTVSNEHLIPELSENEGRKRQSRSSILQQAAATALADPFSPRSTRRRKN